MMGQGFGAAVGVETARKLFWPIMALITLGAVIGFVIGYALH